MNRKRKLNEGYEFEAHLKEASTLKKVIEAIKDLLKQVIFDCNETGIQVQAMDESHVALVSIILRSDGFEKYKCEKPFSFCILLSSLSKILKGAVDKEKLKMEAYADNEGNCDTVTFVFERSDQNKVSEYEMRLMKYDSDHLNIPERDYECTVKLPSAEYTKICRDLLNIGNDIVISCNKEEITFTSYGEQVKAKNRLRHRTMDGEEAVIIAAQEPVSLKFGSQYLFYFSKAAPLSAQVQLSMSVDHPLIVEYHFPEMGEIRYYLAPKIEDDDD